MTTLVPRPPYTKDELDRLYPKQLKLHLVQILLRHGERTPVSARFQNAGLAPYWPYCSVARQLSSAIVTKTDWSSWDRLEWRRRIETFGDNDASVLAPGPNSEIDGVCNLGELTDQGRATTLALGERLRTLYVDQLHFMPTIISNADMIYLRATPMPRALESVQQSFWGMYPLTARTASFAPPLILVRTPQEETLYPNQANCRRFSQLMRAFGTRTASRWNDSPDMAYLSSLISKWMPENSKVAVDSHPRLSGIMDTINSTLAHGPETRLPAPFYDVKGRAIIDKIGVEEWFSGYKESNEYRQTGIGALAGDIVERMVDSVKESGSGSLLESRSQKCESGKGGEIDIKFGMSGCHDTTLAALLASIGCFEGEKWPPYTSHLVFELFKETRADGEAIDATKINNSPPTSTGSHNPLRTLFGGSRKSKSITPQTSRKPTSELSPAEKARLKGHYVRIRYNDRPMTVPGCRLAGKHLDGDESFCTLEAFKAIVDKFTPRSWKEACMSNLDQPTLKQEVEPAGY